MTRYLWLLFALGDQLGGGAGRCSRGSVWRTTGSGGVFRYSGGRGRISTLRFAALPWGVVSGVRGTVEP
jgi:hypothetical protein